MSSLEWTTVYRLIVRAARCQPRPRRTPRYADTLIVALHLWAVQHDRPQCWACDRRHYHRPFRPRKLPSVSQLSRRIRSPRCQAILQQVETWSRPATPPELQLLDSRPLPVGACSKDRQARPGRVYGGFARGYRLHAAMSEKGYFLAWKLTALNTSEKPVARELLQQTRPRGLVLADGNYDAGHLYELVARTGGQLLATPRRSAGRGHRRPHPVRRIALYLWASHAAWLRAQRQAIDRFFGQHSSYGGGLAPLPAWVRTLPRVQRWVQAKIILYHVRLQGRHAAAGVA
jgi:hypothetical protein